MTNTGPPARPALDAASASEDAALVAEGVTKSFNSNRGRITAVSSLTLRVASRKVTGLIGPDGAGKTTLMRLAVGLLHPDAGSMTVLGHDAVREFRAVQGTVGYMPERFGLYEDLTVQENLDLYADLHGLSPESRAARYEELMRMTGLAPFTKRLAGKLSGGMKQKLGLACTLVHPTRLLLLDEPTVGVDPVSRRELWSIINRFVQDEGTTVLLSTAYLDEAERCDEVIILNEGSLIAQGPPSRFTEPLNGRTFKIRVTGRKNRDVQEQLSGQTDVIDAVVQGDAVRVVLKSDVEPKPEILLPNEKNVTISSDPPRFEDGFIAILREQHGYGEPLRESTSRDNSNTTATRVNADGRAIEVRNAKRKFGDFYAVKGISFDVNHGEVFGLLGANGAGKTTMFRMLCGLLPASGGTLHIAGVDVRKTAAAARARIGYMSQRFSLYGTLSVTDNLRFFSSAYGLRGLRRRQRIDWATNEFNLGPVADDHSGTLPLGYKQRLSLACALMHEPEIIFLDEPTSGVDPLARRDFWRRINTLASQGVTVLVTTHFMEEADYCDRLAIMMAGEILSLGTPKEIKESAHTKDTPNPTMEDAFVKLIDARAPKTP